MARSEKIAELFASVGFKIDQQSLKSLDRSLNSIENRVNKLRQTMLGVKAGKNYGDAFKGLERQATGAAAALDNIHKRYKSGVGPLQAYTSATQQLAAAMAQLRAATPTRLPTLPRGGGAGGAAGAGAGFISGLFGGGFSNFARGILPGLGAGWAALHATQSARKTIATENALAALTGSQGAGAAEYKYVKDFSNTYGLKASESADAYKRILASSVGTKMQGAGAKDIFEGVSLYGKTLGLSNENMSRASTAISQMISKGKISSEELKGQLAESLPGAVQLFAKAMNKPVAQMFKMMEDGKVLSEDVLPKVAELLKQQAEAGGALQKSMQSSLSAQNRFLNKWEDFLKMLFENGMDESLAKFFQGLTVALSALQPVLISVGKAFRFLFQAVEAWIVIWKAVPGFMQDAIIAFTAFKVLMAAGAWTWLKSHPLFVFFSLIFLILEDFYNMTQGYGSVFGDLLGFFGVDGITAFDPFFKKFDEWLDTLSAARDLVRDILSMVGLGGSTTNKNIASATGSIDSLGKAISVVPGVGPMVGPAVRAFAKGGSYITSAEGIRNAAESTKMVGNALLPAPVQIIIQGVTDPVLVGQEVKRVLGEQARSIKNANTGNSR